jgi:hypothetical protein
MYFYESHLGGLYTSNIKYSYDDLYCEECGDSDTYLGKYDSWEDFIKNGIDENFYFSVEYLSEESGLTVEKILELNPKLAELDNWEEDEDEN